MALARLLRQQSALPYARLGLRDRLLNLLAQRREVLLDAIQAHNNTRRSMADLHQPILLHRYSAREVATLVLVREKNGQLRLQLRRVSLRIAQDNLGDDADRTL